MARGRQRNIVITTATRSYDTLTTAGAFQRTFGGGPSDMLVASGLCRVIVYQVQATLEKSEPESLRELQQERVLLRGVRAFLDDTNLALAAYLVSRGATVFALPSARSV